MRRIGGHAMNLRRHIAHHGAVHGKQRRLPAVRQYCPQLIDNRGPAPHVRSVIEDRIAEKNDVRHKISDSRYGERRAAAARLSQAYGTRRACQARSLRAAARVSLVKWTANTRQGKSARDPSRRSIRVTRRNSRGGAAARRRTEKYRICLFHSPEGTVSRLNEKYARHRGEQK